MTVTPARLTRLAWAPHAARALWVLAAALLAISAWRLTSQTWSQLPPDPSSPIEDRRAYRFRDLTYTQTVGILRIWLQQAYRGGPPRQRGLALARVAAMQRERGLVAEANAADEEALRLSGDDREVRAVLARPLSAEDLSPVP